MVYNFMIWAAYGMALLILASLYFSYVKLKIKYKGIINFIMGQLLVSTSLILLWFLDDRTKYYITPFIGIFLIFGAYELHVATIKFVDYKAKFVEIYILSPLSFLVYIYFLYIQESLMMQVVSLYLISSYVFFKSAFIIFLSKERFRSGTPHILSVTALAFSVLYMFRVLDVFMTNRGRIDYTSLRDYQIATVIATYILQIILTFIASNLVYDRAKIELRQINYGFHDSPLSMVMINDRQEVVDTNRRFMDFLGYERTEMIGRRICELDLFKDVCHTSEFEQFMELTHPIHNKELSVITKNGTHKRILMSISELDFVYKQNSIITLTDISEIHVLKEKLNDYAYYDDLTNLPNRRYLTRYFKAKTLENKRFALMCIDLDNFKTVNDSFGHTIGDEVLAYLSNRLMKSIGVGDFVARYAGDEFIVIVDLEDKDKCLESKIDQIIYAIEHEFNISNAVFKLKASIGLSEFPLHGMELNDLIKKADSEMYQNKRMAKSNGQL